jgi:hypothetical protein
MELGYFKNKLNIKEERVLFFIQAINFNKIEDIKYLLNFNKYKEKEIVLFLILSFNGKNKDIFNEIINNKNLHNNASKNKILRIINNKKNEDSIKNKSTRLNFINNLIKEIKKVGANELKIKIENF